MCGLCSVAVCSTARTPDMHLLTKARSVIDPTSWVKADGLLSRPTA